MLNIKDSKGSVLIQLALSLSALVIVLTVSYEAGVLTHAKNRAQAAVDSATLSAVLGIISLQDTGSTALVEQGLQNYLNTTDLSPATSGNETQMFSAEAKGLVGADGLATGQPDYLLQYVNDAGVVLPVDALNPVPRPDISGVRVTKRYLANHTFGDMVGANQTGFQVVAEAHLGGPSCYQPTLPVVLLNIQAPHVGNCDASQIGSDKTHAFHQGQWNPSTTDNLAWWERYEPQGGQQISDNECAAYVKKEDHQGNPVSIPTICIGEPISLNNGVLSDCLKEIRDTRWKLVPNRVPSSDQSFFCGDEVDISAVDENGNYITWEKSEIVPVVNMTCDASGNCDNPVQQMPVVGFAKINITCVSAPSKGKEGQGGVASADPNHFMTFNVSRDTIPNTIGGGMTCGSRASIPLLVKPN